MKTTQRFALGIAGISLMATMAFANDETAKHDAEYARNKALIAQKQAEQEAANAAALKAAADARARDSALDNLVKTVPKSPSNKGNAISK